MIQELKSLLTPLGLSPAWVSVVVLLVAILIYLVRMRLTLQNSLEQVKATAKATYEFDRQAKIDDRLFDYAREQETALREAYRMLYENEEVQPTERGRFVEIVKEADRKVMEPITAYGSFLDKDTKSCILAVHGILDQMTHEPSEEAIRGFVDFKGDFYNHFIKKASEKMSEIASESRYIEDNR